MTASRPTMCRQSARQNTRPLQALLLLLSPVNQRIIPARPLPATRANATGGIVDIFGSFALLLAFLAAVYAFGAGIAGILTRRTLLTKSARNAGMAVFVLVTLAVASLEYFFFTDDFSMADVA